MDISYGQITLWNSVSNVLKSEPNCTSHKPRASCQRQLVRGDLVHGICPHAATQSYTYLFTFDILMQDVYNKNMSIYDIPGMEIWVQIMSTMPSPYPELAERIYITSSWEEFDNITKYFLLEKESFFFHVESIISIYYFKIIGNTCSNGWQFNHGRTELGNRERNSLVQIQEASSHPPCFCGRRVSQQQEVASH